MCFPDIETEFIAIKYKSGLLRPSSPRKGFLPLSLEVRALSCAPRRMATRTARCHPSRLAEDGEHLRMTVVLNRALERFGEIGLFPGEAALIVGGAAEMAVGRGAGVDRPVEVEMGADAARRQIHRFRHRLLELVFAYLPGAVGIDIDRQRPRHADRVSELQRAAAGKAGGDDVLGEIARGIGGGAVHFGRILAGEGAAAMRGGAA